jgi:hypothetical protein
MLGRARASRALRGAPPRSLRRTETNYADIRPAEMQYLARAPAAACEGACAAQKQSSC